MPGCRSPDNHPGDHNECHGVHRGTTNDRTDVDNNHAGDIDDHDHLDDKPPDSR